MKRGSFNYKQTIWKKAKLKKDELVPCEGGFDLRFDKDSKPYTFSVREQNGLIRAELIQPDYHKQYNRFAITIPVEKDLHFYGRMLRSSVLERQQMERSVSSSQAVRH